MTKKKIAILGGSFDPPHIGHIRLADMLTEHFDEIWIMPTYDHAHGKNTAHHAHRLKMCRLAFTLYNPFPSSKIQVCDFEIENEISGGTIELLKELQRSFPHEFYFVIGQDNADSIHTWRKHEQLLLFTPFFVVPRAGYSARDDSNTWYMKPPHRYLKTSIILPQISSTEIRKSILQKEIPQYLTIEVHNYIKKEKLYQA